MMDTLRCDVNQRKHQEKVARVVEQVRRAARSGRPAGLRKRAVSHFVPNPGSRAVKPGRIDLSSLDEILEIDVERRRCVAEPGVTFHELTSRTLARGLMPATVPELKTITVGGAVSGCSLESLSYRRGGFHESCLEYEVVTSDGEVLRCGRERHRDLFEMLHGSYGTLAPLTELTFELLPARPYVRLEHRSFRRLADFWEALQRHCDEGSDERFIDAIIHDPGHFVLCLGSLVDRAPYLSSYDGTEIYYKSTRERTEDYLTTQDYFFRYDTECHWLSRTVPPLEWAPVRRLLGPYVLGSTNLITWSKRLEPILSRVQRRPDVVVDVFVPDHRFEEFFEWYRRVFDFWPLWIVPYRAPDASYPWISDEHAERMGSSFLIDCAIYGKRNTDPDTDLSERLERKVFELGGIKTLISRNHYDEATFWSVYSRPRYDAAKARLDPAGLFPDLYRKFHAA